VVAADPLREQAQRSLMAVLDAGGNYAAELLAYRELRLRLHRELNAKPDPETQQLFHRLQAEAREKASAIHAACPPRRGESLAIPPRLPLSLTRFFGREASGRTACSCSCS
jgi:hypothetical protein